MYVMIGLVNVTEDMYIKNSKKKIVDHCGKNNFLLLSRSIVANITIDCENVIPRCVHYFLVCCRPCLNK